MLPTFLRRYGPVFLATAVLIPHARLFDFVSDDAYISFRYARNLALHGELVFNLGERVEGYTNFLWTVLLAIGMKLGVGPVILSRFLGMAFAVGTLAVVVRVSLRLSGERPGFRHVFAPLGLAATGAFACWVSGGLETQLFTFLTTLAVALYLEERERARGWASALVFGLAALTRPEGALFFALTCVHRLVGNVRRERRLRPARHEIAWLGVFALVLVPYFAWRWWYYGFPFPNTFYVKAAAGPETWKRGFYYLGRLVQDYDGVLAALVVGLGWPRRSDERRRDFFTLAVLMAGVFAVYVAKVGGDFMGLYRFVLPLFPLAALCVQEGALRIGERLVPRLGRVPVAGAGALLVSAYLVGSVRVTKEATTFVGADNGIDTPAYLEKYADDRVPIGRWFGRHAQPDDLMTVGGAGVIPYYAGIRAYDVFGLVDERIAHDASMTVSDRPGHQKWGSDAYMLSRRPTLVTHHYRIHERHVPSAAEAEDWARRGYEWVTAEIPEISPPYYSFLKRIDRAFGPFPARAPVVR